MALVKKNQKLKRKIHKLRFLNGTILKILMPSNTNTQTYWMVLSNKEAKERKNELPKHYSDLYKWLAAGQDIIVTPTPINDERNMFVDNIGDFKYDETQNRWVIRKGKKIILGFSENTFLSPSKSIREIFDEHDRFKDLDYKDA